MSDKLKEILEMKKMKPADLAKSTGLTNGYISKLLRNERIPGAEILEKIHKATNVNIRWLLTGEGEMFTNKKSTERSPMDIMRDVLKEEFDFTDKELSALEKLLVRKEVIILLTKALEGDSTAKELVKKIINQD